MALLLIVGGGTIGITTRSSNQPVHPAATVNDLQILDKNEQALQQFDQMLQETPADTDTPPQS
jgi:hypothetical protein